MSDAIARHGLPAFGVIVFRALRAQGLQNTLRIAAGDQPFLSAAPIPADAARRSGARWPPELDAEGAVSAAGWNEWIRRSPKTSNSKAPGRISAAFVVPARPGGPDSAVRTSDAVRALGSDVVLIETPDFIPNAETLYIFLQPGDAPNANLISELSAAVAGGQTYVVSFDLFRPLGERVQPLLLPGANPTLLAARDYLYSRMAVMGAVLLETSALNPREAVLAWCARRSVEEVRAGWRHVPRPLVGLEAIQTQVTVRPTEPGNPAARRRRAKRQRVGVTAVICTRDKGHLTRQLVRQLLALSQDQIGEVVILSNGTTNPYALQTLADLGREPRVQVIVADEPFNFSRLCNRGVRETRSKGPLLFLNDDIAPVSEDWLESLTDQLMVPGTGAVGPLLLYPNERVQQAGMYLRFPSGVGHILRGAALPEDDPLGLAVSAREVSALTGAVLLTDRAAFEGVGGFDEQLAISFQDVDYCLKLNRQGLRNVFEPGSILIHMESVSLDRAGSNPELLLQRYRERALFMDRWTPVFGADPFYPAGLDLSDEGGRRLSRAGPGRG